MTIVRPIHGASASRHQEVRQGIRALLTAADGFEQLDADTKRDVANSLVRISATALQLADISGAKPPSPAPRQLNAPLAMAQSGGFSNAAVDEIAPQTERILNAVSFPRFVGELITGVFKAMNESNEQQLESYVELIRNVAASTDDFADANVGAMGAREWLVGRFPGTFRIDGDDEPGFDNPSEMSPDERAEWQAERAASQRLVLAPGAEMPSAAALRTALGAPEGTSLPSGNPEALVAPVRALLARNKQAMLATMVKMGMQRIVIDSGQLNASMRFHIDATSAATEDRGSTFDFRNELSAQASARFGPWGGSAKMKNTIGYVSTEATQTEQEVNAEIDLDSSVQLVFRTDYVPLNRLAGDGDVQRIAQNSLNPSAETAAARQRREARRTQRDTERSARRGVTTERLRPPELPDDPPDRTVESYEPTQTTESGGGSDESTETQQEGNANDESAEGNTEQTGNEQPSEGSGSGDGGSGTG